MYDVAGNVKAEISAVAARLVVEEGLEFGPAKRRATKLLGLNARTALPSNEMLDDAVHAYIALVCAETQPGELLALRRLALQWMERLRPFRPHLGGAVWRGTATRLSNIHIALFCDDPKGPAMALVNDRLQFEADTVKGLHGREVEALALQVHCPDLDEQVVVQLVIYEHDDVRGALRMDGRGRAQRGGLTALAALLEPARVAAVPNA